MNKFAKDTKDVDSYIERMKNNGFIKRFVIKPEGLHDEETGKYYPPHKVKIINFYFFEGESSSDNAFIVYGIETYDKQKGTIISTKII